MANSLQEFIELMRHQFNADEQELINEKTDIKSLKGWSSLQNMIVVNEIDKQYGVILDSDDFIVSKNLKELFVILQSKII